MRRLALALIILILLGPGILCAADSSSTRTGWFSDLRCASERVHAGRIGPTGRACTRECLAKGVPMAFIDEKEKAVFKVDNPKVVRKREGDYVQIEGVLKDAKTLHVTSVRVLEKYAATCSVD